MSSARLGAVVLLAVMVASCSDPGEGWKFERACAAGDPAVMAIKAFTRDKGRVPKDMYELVPAYLSRPQLDKLGADDSIGFEYVVLSDDKFEFRMNYRGPGSNECVYVQGSSPPEWSCFRAY